MNRNYIILFLSSFIFSVDKIDINTANYDQLSSIPLSEEKIDSIIKYLNNFGYIEFIYDLNKLDLLTVEDIQILKEYTKISSKKTADTKNLGGLIDDAYKIMQWLSSEGVSEGRSEFWLDSYLNKSNVNEMGYNDFLKLPNLSPMDAVAIMNQQDRGEIKGTFQLKNSPGISHYGYKNLLDFITFDNSSDKGTSVRFTAMSNNSLSYDGVDEEEIPVGTFISDRPQTFSKLFYSINNKIKVGALRYNHLGDLDNIYSKKAFISFEDLYLIGSNKYNYKQTPDYLKIDKIIIGNFSASFGQGVIFESGDSYAPRTTGYGFSKRKTGISYDLTRSHQFVLSGYATQISNRKFNLSLFYSDGSLINNNMRDAVINEDGSFSSFITMKPRLSYGFTNNISKLLGEDVEESSCSNNLNTWISNSSNDGLGDCYKIYIYEDMINSVEERTIGGNVRFDISNSFNFGFTMYESMYDRVLDPQILDTMIGGDGDVDDSGFDPADDWDEYSGDGNFYIGYMSNSADPEIRAMYSNYGESDIWSKAKSYRRVSGVEFTKVFGNMSIQGEYGELHVRDDENPSAYVINAFMQFDNLNFLVLFRDYDLHYDNPYQRSFSEYRRYKSTIFEDAYWLEDPVFYNLYSANSQPQAERGYYVESRYQFHEDLVAGIQWDVWTRKADNARYFRIVNKLEWRPLFNYRIYFRYKLQSRGTNDIAHPSPYFSKEARIRFKIRLSNYDFVEFLYSWNYTTFSPRPRLTGNSNALGGDMTQGDIGKPEGSIGFMISHNFSKYLNMKGGIVYADGFLWYIEDNDFRLFDTNQGIVHSWISLRVNPTNALAINIKMSNSSDYPSTTIVSGQLDDGSWIINPYVGRQETNWKIQLSYAI